MSRRVVALISLGLLGLALAGCGSGPAAATVSGEVKANGAPVAKGFISFAPADGVGDPVTGEIKDGRYSVATTAGNWKWVRLDTAGAPVDLKALRLRNPAAVHAILADHSGGDGPIALDAVLEKK